MPAKRSNVMDIHQDDYKAAFCYLAHRALGGDDPMPTIGGKKAHDLQAFVKLMPRGDDLFYLSLENEALVSPILSGPNLTYFRSAWALYHIVRQRETAAQRRAAIKRMYAQA
ncbi:hypothetical protein ASD50_17135 [Mesorhizobium sp. Root552]|nr:hypothetical protein ASD50_17135 [Mesorhizobium sp. Root552]